MERHKVRFRVGFSLSANLINNFKKALWNNALGMIGLFKSSYELLTDQCDFGILFYSSCSTLKFVHDIGFQVQLLIL